MTATNNIVRYFVLDGKRCEYGEIVNLKYGDEIIPATFIAHVTDKHYYVFKIYNKKYKDGHYYASYNINDFKRNLIGYTGKMDEIQLKEKPLESMTCIKKPTLKEELEIDGMLIAWVWYIFLMGITLIFNGFALYWLFFSIIFGMYRSKKLKEEGYK